MYLVSAGLEARNSLCFLVKRCVICEALCEITAITARNCIAIADQSLPDKQANQRRSKAQPSRQLASSAHEQDYLAEQTAQSQWLSAAQQSAHNTSTCCNLQAIRSADSIRRPINRRFVSTRRRRRHQSVSIFARHFVRRARQLERQLSGAYRS